jgi:hypothetical protein
VSELTGPFRLKDLGLETEGDLDRVREVNISKVNASEVAAGDGDADGFEMNLGDGDGAQGGGSRTVLRQTGADSDEEEDYLEALEHQMDTYYEKFKAKREQAQPRTVQQRRMEIQAAKYVFNIWLRLFICKVVVLVIHSFVHAFIHSYGHTYKHAYWRTYVNK